MNARDAEPWDDRLQETEIRLAFLDRELGEYKDAVQTLHARLEILEKTVESLKRAAQGGAETTGAAGTASGFSG